jgi:hypothetical protein
VDYSFFSTYNVFLISNYNLKIKHVIFSLYLDVHGFVFWCRLEIILLLSKSKHYKSPPIFKFSWAFKHPKLN